MKRQEVDKLINEYFVMADNRLKTKCQNIDQRILDLHNYLGAIMDFLGVEIKYTQAKYYCQKKKH